MKRFYLTLSAALLASLPLMAGTPANVEILPGWQTGAGTRMAALHIQLEPGWKTYWRAPGEAGLPPQFDWSGSQNVASVRLMWPVPDVFASSGMTTFGYHDELVLPIEITPADPGAEIVLDGALTMGVCKDICMPLQTHVSATLPQGEAPHDARITAALDDQPQSAAKAGVVAADCTVAPIADGLRVTATIEMPQVGTGERVVMEGPSPDIWVSETMTERAGGTLTATADMVPPSAQPFDLAAKDVRLTVLAGGRGVDIEGCDRLRP